MVFCSNAWKDTLWPVFLKLGCELAALKDTSYQMINNATFLSSFPPPSKIGGKIKLKYLKHNFKINCG